MASADTARRGVLGKVRRVVRPLHVSQGAASAAGALVVLLAAWNMPPEEFATFSLLVLVLNLAVGLARSALFQPALIERRHDPAANVPIRYLAVMAAMVLVGVLVADGLLTRVRWSELGLLGVASLAPIVHDWLRFRCIGQGRNVVVASSDCLRLALTPAVLLVATWSDSALGYYLTWCAAYAVAAVPLALFASRPASHTPYRAYGSQARSQAYEFVVAQLATTLPLLVLGGLALSPVFGAFRLAQTFYGPLNVLFGAVALNLLSDVVATTGRPSDQEMVARTRRLGLLSLGLAGVLGVVLLAAIALGILAPSGVEPRELAIALVCTGVYAALGGLVGPHIVTLRILRAQSAVTRARIGLVLLAWAGFVAGYYLDGVLLSLVLGFVLGGVGYPLFFLRVARRTYRSMGLSTARPGARSVAPVAGGGA